ncbi:hypothetical protein K525DRAFT_214945 [Schizophyllum commune Loenen D]|nr:hypothetical protein K525DRAFT_214945 [Schizophyllum commune Loenen D]
MVPGLLFDWLCAVGKSMRPATGWMPFGGIQLVVTGDFFQLPPVSRARTDPVFAFETKAWQETFSRVIQLTQVYRQTDPSV